MHIFSLAWWSLWVLLLEATATPTMAYPETVEVDLVFPHNDTYTPTPITPVVFAIQNSTFAENFILGIAYTIYDASTGDNTAGGILHLRRASFTESDPYFVYDGAQEATTTDGRWKMQWDLQEVNCSGDPSNPTYNFDIRGNNPSTELWFSTEKGAQDPDLVATTTDPDACAQSPGFAFSITGTLDVPFRSDLRDDVDSCAVLSTVEPSPAPSPRKVQISHETSSEISAAMTSTACETLDPVVSCSSTETDEEPEPKQEQEETQSEGREVPFLEAAFGLLAYFFISDAEKDGWIGRMKNKGEAVEKVRGRMIEQLEQPKCSVRASIVTSLISWNEVIGCPLRACSIYLAGETVSMTKYSYTRHRD